MQAIERSPSKAMELAILLPLAAAFAPALLAMARVWSTVDYQSHGYLVPVVAGWIAWSTRPRRARLPSVQDARGALLLAAALALYAASLLASSASGQGLALVAAASGAIWYLRGWHQLRALAFPLGFLLFMVPIPPDWLAPVIVRLLDFVSSASVGLLQGFGVTVAREGNVIRLPGGQDLFVAEACSGLTSLVTLTPIAVLIAYLTPIGTLRRVLLVALVVPIAMAANLLRVVATVLGARAWNAAAVTGDPVHTLLGLAVYAVGCLGLLAVARALAVRRAAPARAA
jgi:exosortase